VTPTVTGDLEAEEVDTVTVIEEVDMVTVTEAVDTEEAEGEDTAALLQIGSKRSLSTILDSLESLVTVVTPATEVMTDVARALEA